jgi:omega-hydroxy-beta-dihydromenaquinone-9 sulfotransferase
MLLWQSLVPASLSSSLNRLQQSIAREQLAKANLQNSIVVLGYWRSGTTLLHELLCLDVRYTYPTTHACMNPHHFLLTEASALARDTSTTRPMDEMEVRASSPQEDEFALLCMGARSPYEALIVPTVLPDALKLSDPRDLSAPDEKRWREIFLGFLAGVSARGSGRPMILKSPTHGFRVSTLRELLPEARFILIVRDPLTNFESVVRMWQKMFETYALGPIPSGDEIREAVLGDRLRFEEKLAASTVGLPANRFAKLSYESFVANPVELIQQLYTRLELGDFAVVQDAITSEINRRRGYRAKGSLPSPKWRERLNHDWSGIMARYAAMS